MAFGLVVLALATAVGWLHQHIARFDDPIMLSAARNNVDFYLVKALIFEESWFRPDVHGTAGELGLMQITKAAAADYAARHWLPPFNEQHLCEPELNIEIGCWYLRQSLDRYTESPDPVVFALLRYNAGAARADQWLQKALAKPAPVGVLPERYYLSLVDIPKTREYVHHILQHYRSRNFLY